MQLVGTAAEALAGVVLAGMDSTVIVVIEAAQSTGYIHALYSRCK